MGVEGFQLRQEQNATDSDDELIPTAILIQNIPFAIRKEHLVDIMTHMQLPLPYAFNYHFENGFSRGSAFANFTSADETAQVIDGLNHFELQGQKLCVEYKKTKDAAYHFDEYFGLQGRKLPVWHKRTYKKTQDATSPREGTHRARETGAKRFRRALIIDRLQDMWKRPEVDSNLPQHIKEIYTHLRKESGEIRHLAPNQELEENIPTRENTIKALSCLVQDAKSGDSFFLIFSG